MCIQCWKGVDAEALDGADSNFGRLLFAQMSLSPVLIYVVEIKTVALPCIRRTTLLALAPLVEQPKRIPSRLPICLAIPNRAFQIRKHIPA